jgi:hypothetical protein
MVRSTACESFPLYARQGASARQEVTLLCGKHTLLHKARLLRQLLLLPPLPLLLLLLLLFPNSVSAHTVHFVLLSF